MAESNPTGTILYGCYGYTGKLIAEMAAEQGYPLLLSGRSEEKTRAVAEATGHPWHCATLDEPAGLDALLKRGNQVIHAAGPFVDTYHPMAEACLRTGVHYLDITGEIGVFQGLADMDEQAIRSGTMLMPGVGFDVVPTDCMAAALKQLLPDATHLDLAFKMLGGTSHGTASTMVRSLGESSLVRRNGTIVPARAGRDTVRADFGQGPQKAYGIPWGDVFTAWHTTGIPNIATYVALPATMGCLLQMSGPLGWLLRSRWVRGVAQRRIDRRPAGPDEETRKKGKSEIWGRVRNAAGKEVSLNFRCQEGYTLTAMASLCIARKVAEGHFKPGFQTPAGCFGAELINEVTGIKLL